ncbi:MAG: molybdenum cofactor guanylyltransferase [Clostridiales bacterium]|nr:molybdenum cofactor guanylyltransferase [Clostridiales bacterium]
MNTNTTSNHTPIVTYASAAVLAGGKSSRMGTDKALLTLYDNTLAGIAIEKFKNDARFSEVLLSANDEARYAFLEVPVIPDRIRDQGPLQGLIACLAAARREYTCFLPCDAPLIPEGLPGYLLDAAFLADADAAVPVREGGEEPLTACYRKTMLPVFERLAESGKRKVSLAFADPSVRILRVDLSLPEPAGLFGNPASYLVNANDPETFRALGNGD